MASSPENHADPAASAAHATFASDPLRAYVERFGVLPDWFGAVPDNMARVLARQALRYRDSLSSSQ